MSICVNLKSLIGDKYKTGYEPAYFAEYGKGARTEEPWLMTIPCAHGEIYPHGGEMLTAWCEGPKFRKGLASLPCCEVHQWGKDAATFIFHVSHFEQVAEIMKPKKRRRLSAEQRAALSERIKPYRFSRENEPGTRSRNPIIESISNLEP